MADNCLPSDVNGGKIVPKRRAKQPVQVSPSPDDHLAAIRDDLLLVFAAYQRLKAHVLEVPDSTEQAEEQEGADLQHGSRVLGLAPESDACGPAKRTCVLSVGI